MSATVVVGKPGASTREYCYPESRTTTFFWSGCENHDAPRVDYWRCQNRPCGHVRIQMADVTDAESLVRSVVAQKIHGTGSVDYGDERSIDRDDLISEGRELLWRLYLKWNPAVGTTFMSYASHYLPLRLVGWWRQRFGTDGCKPLGHAVSLDADKQEDGPGRGDRGSLAPGPGDAGEGGGLVLREMVARVHRQTLGLDGGNGGGPGEGAANRTARAGR